MCEVVVDGLASEASYLDGSRTACISVTRETSPALLQLLMNGAPVVWLRGEKNLQLFYHLIYPGAVLRILHPTLLDQFP